MAATDELKSIRVAFEKLNADIISDKRAAKDARKALQLYFNRRDFDVAWARKRIQKERDELKDLRSDRDNAFEEAAKILDEMQNTMDEIYE